MVSKKAQMKIQQMIFMLVAVALLFILVGIFFLSITLYNLRKTASDLEQKNAMLLVSKLANSPEFSCGNAFGTGRISCIDFDKVIALKGLVDENSNLWGVAEIEIMKIYPAGEKVECTVSNYPDCNSLIILDRNVNTLPAAYNYVSLCRKESNGFMTYDKCELAMLLVSSEEKR